MPCSHLSYFEHGIKFPAYNRFTVQFYYLLDDQGQVDQKGSTILVTFSDFAT